MESGCGWFKAKGRKGRKLRQEVGTSPLCLPGSGYKGFWVCIPRCSWPSKPSGGESAGVENGSEIVMTGRRGFGDLCAASAVTQIGQTAVHSVKQTRSNPEMRDRGEDMVIRQEGRQ